MTQTTDDFAFLAADVYKVRRDDDLVHNKGHSYVVVDSAMDVATGFYARTYRDQASGEAIIAFRGTDDLLDGAVDLAMVGTRLNAQSIESEMYTKQTMRDAAKLAEKQGYSAPVLVTGHSLGGGLAQLNAEKFGLKGETFNPYGIVGMRGHDVGGGTQVINHMRATDPVSAASQHFGETRVYATADDIELLQAAGYDRTSQVGSAALLGSMRVSSHSMSNFEDKPNGSGIADATNARRYEDNRSLIDNFRSDLLNQRTLLTSQLDQPALIGVRAMQGPARAVGAAVLGEGLFVVGEAPRGVQAVRDGAASVAEAAQHAAHRVAETFSDPRMANALGSATYGMSPAAVPSNNADMRRHDHPGHELYAQAHKGVEQVDKQLGRTPDAATEKVAGALAVAAARDGLKRIDHVVLNEDGSKAFGVQGELNSPFKQIVQVDTAQATETPVEESSKQWIAAAEAYQQQAQVQQQAQEQMQAQSQAGPRPHGP
ncbi:XVIPCD domain-containing protein [Luteibacter yeojuensis]|uniref:X-Tfes XVIPCD domain-containing protein n=1 Tax=Luteibacter yeojuensis TaxID=345309 RepID=A0A0F3KG99_9GAMM|nr:XVIPCD domain-containing protein [Luteibacter yeojuensis]KJV29129.1 hypothetical protein VI08_16220 [Luteibacter yeojuensis]